MAEPFIGQIMPAAFKYAPKGWALCNGQLLTIAQNTTLFALLGTYYGGDGKTTFALPDLRGRTPIHWGQGNGLPNIIIGESAGEENHTLVVTEMPVHSHVANANTSANQSFPAGMIWGGDTTGTLALYSDATPDSVLNQQALTTTGGNIPHNNIQPSLVISFCIALQGIFPSRN